MNEFGTTALSLSAELGGGQTPLTAEVWEVGPAAVAPAVAELATESADPSPPVELGLIMPDRDTRMAGLGRNLAEQRIVPCWRCCAARPSDRRPRGSPVGFPLVPACVRSTVLLLVRGDGCEWLPESCIGRMEGQERRNASTASTRR
jgi:hypothetical protein